MMALDVGKTAFILTMNNILNTSKQPIDSELTDEQREAIITQRQQDAISEMADAIEVYIKSMTMTITVAQLTTGVLPANGGGPIQTGAPIIIQGATSIT